jgi:hypothetical protein
MKQASVQKITKIWDQTVKLYVINPTVYNRSIYKYNLIDVYKYNHMLLQMHS